MSKFSGWVDGPSIYVGDPCYVFTDSEWDEIMAETNVFGFGDNHKIKFDGNFWANGRKCVVAATADGDGSFLAYAGNAYIGTVGVDSGSIAAIPVSAISDEMLREAARLGFIVPDDAMLVIAEDGNFQFGNIKIDTRCPLTNEG